MTDLSHAKILQDIALSDDSIDLSTKPAAAHIAALSSDLMLSVRLEAIAQGLGCSIEAVPALSGLLPALTRMHVDVVLLDLADATFPIDAVCSAVRAQAPEAKVVAFFPHVRTELGSAAAAAGCDVVMPRSRLLTNPGEALRGILPAKVLREPTARESGGDA